MSINRLFEPGYMNQLYESMKHLKFADIKNLCRSNKDIANYCQNNALFQKLIREKHSEAIEERIDQYITEGGRGRQGRSERNLNYVFDIADRKGDVEVMKELLKGPLDPYILESAAHYTEDPEILSMILRKLPAKISDKYSDLLIFYRTLEHSDIDGIVKICSLNKHLFAHICQSPYVRRLIKRKREEKARQNYLKLQQWQDEHPSYYYDFDDDQY